MGIRNEKIDVSKVLEIAKIINANYVDVTFNIYKANVVYLVDAWDVAVIFHQILIILTDQS